MTESRSVPSIPERDLGLLREKFPDIEDFHAALKRLERREPLAYVLGEWYFYDEVYRVSPDCLIPRPETEHLVEELIKRLPAGGCFADLCTGSGCIAVSVLAHRPDCRAVGVDLSPAALKIADFNAKANGVNDRIEWVVGDITKGNLLGDRKFDIIVSNPPYVDTAVIDTLEPEVRYEPRIALDGGEDGLRFYRALLERWLIHIKEDGFLICEIGYDQGDRLKALCPCEIKKDYSGCDRVMILKNPRSLPSSPAVPVKMPR